MFFRYIVEGRVCIRLFRSKGYSVYVMWSRLVCVEWGRGIRRMGRVLRMIG